MAPQHITGYCQRISCNLSKYKYFGTLVLHILPWYTTRWHILIIYIHIYIYIHTYNKSCKPNPILNTAWLYWYKTENKIHTEFPFNVKSSSYRDEYLLNLNRLSRSITKILSIAQWLKTATAPWMTYYLYLLISVIIKRLSNKNTITFMGLCNSNDVL